MKYSPIGPLSATILFDLDVNPFPRVVNLNDYADHHQAQDQDDRNSGTSFGMRAVIDPA
jgi:hypothetical protein